MMRKVLPAFMLALVMVLAFSKVIFHRDFTLLTGEDTATSYYPWMDVASYWLKKGVVLLWDPYVYAGKFNMGEPQPGLYYPLNWPIMLLPAKGGGMSLDGMQALMILDYFLAGLFTFLLARSLGMSIAGALLAGAAFPLGGYTAQIYGYLNVLSGFVWMPLALLLFRRSLLGETRAGRLRNALGAGAVLGLSFLSGHHIPPIHTGFLLLLYGGFTLLRGWSASDWRRRLTPALSLATAALVSLLLTAFQWLPSAQWARHVFRWVGAANPVRWGEKVPYSVLEQSSNLSPQDALSLVLPYVSVSANLYVGAGVLFLGLVGMAFVREREAPFFTISMFLCFLLSWGRHSAIHGWFNTFVPGLWFAREVFYYLIPFHLCLAVLSGWGLDHLIRSYAGRADARLRSFIRGSVWIMAFLVLGSGALVASLHMQAELPMNHPYITALSSLSLFVTILGLLLRALHQGWLSSTRFGSLVIALAVADLASHVSRDIQPKAKPEGERNTYVREFWREPASVRFLKEERRKAHFRVDDPENLYPPNYGDAWRLDATMGHGATALVDYFTFRGIGWGPGSNATALLNALYFPARTEVPGWEVVSRVKGEVLHRNPRAVPRAFVAARFRAFPTDAEILDWLAQPVFAPAETVLLRDSDLARLPAGLRRDLQDDGAGIRVRVQTRRAAADGEADKLSDREARRRLLLFQPPWGWSPGDALSLILKPESDGSECYAIFRYLPGAADGSSLSLRLEADGMARDIPVGLPAGAARKAGVCRQIVRLGNLPLREHRLSFVVPEGCSARLDSVRFTREAVADEDDPASALAIVSHKPNRIRLRAEMRKAGFVVLSEVYYPGWEARIDGEPAPLLKADYILRAIPVPAGDHTIELRFRPAALSWGLMISALSLAGLAAIWIRLR